MTNCLPKPDSPEAYAEGALDILYASREANRAFCHVAIDNCQALTMRKRVDQRNVLGP